MVKKCAKDKPKPRGGEQFRKLLKVLGAIVLMAGLVFHLLTKTDREKFEA